MTNAGGGGAGVIAITSTARAALRRLRDIEDPVCIWVDAICIDQGNVAEKNVQVAMVARIYAMAGEALAWLADEGLCPCHKHRIVELIHAWHDFFVDCEPTPRLGWATPDRLEGWWSRWQDRQADVVCEVCGSEDFSRSASAMEQFESVGRAPWLQRRWIIQEAALASRVTFLFGKHAAAFAQAFTRFDWFLAQVSPGFHRRNVGERGLQRASATFKQIARLRMGELLSKSIEPTAGGSRLLHELVSSADLAGAVTHDVVYAVRSIARVESSSALTPDYALPLAELWMRVVREILLRDPRPIPLLWGDGELQAGDAECIKTVRLE